MIGLLTSRDYPSLTDEDRLLQREIQQLGCDVQPVVWDLGDDDCRAFEVLVFRSTWDYPEKINAFLDFLNGLARNDCQTLNPIPTIRWNIDKHYLQDLQKKDVRTIPTYYPDASESLADIIRSMGWTDVVVKPRISADGYRTFRTTMANAEHYHEFAALQASPNGVIVQPFLPEVAVAGEGSFVFLGGEYSHAAWKKPARDDYRVQHRFGGTAEPWRPAREQIRAAHRVLDAVELPWTYARVDACIDGDSLTVMEVELIEPSLFLDFEPSPARRFADLIVASLHRPNVTG